jgi:glycine hydroxymethyltransferase
MKFDFNQLTLNELNRQKSSLNLIASENYPSPGVLKEMGSIWSVKYGEGYPQKRYYAGNEYTDILEQKVMDLALLAFCPKGGYGVNLQALSGSIANSLVYLSILKPQDKILSLSLDQGGHLSHLHSTSSWNKFFEHVTYQLKEVSNDNFEIDIEDFEKVCENEKPRLVILGFSSYPKNFDFKTLISIAHKHKALVLADISHINGLVVAGLHSSPFDSDNQFENADFITMTTHKTLRGPRNAVIFARSEIPNSLSDILPEKKSLIQILNQSIFPGVLGGPHFNKISALGVCLEEALDIRQYPDKVPFKKYMENVLKNAKAMENEFLNQGIEIISPTQNHLLLIKLTDNIDSLDFQIKLEKNKIITNRNTIPFDKKSPYRPSGMRFGTPALTSRGLTEYQAIEIAKIISDLIKNPDLDKTQEVENIISNLNFYY